ncbi:MAG: type VI secretion system Vgr family protein [Polyangiaceae bacterium]
MSDHETIIELICPELPGSVALTRLDGYEGLNEYFDLELTFERPDGELDLDACVKASTRSALVFKLKDEIVRVMHGNLAEISTRIDTVKDAITPHRTLVARFVPRVWSSTLHSRTEVHYGTVREILSSLLERCALEQDLDYEFRLSETYPTREFVLQYHESDYDFLRRQCEQWGLCWSFEHGSRDRIIFSDHNSALLDIAAWQAGSGEAADSDDSDQLPENPSADAGHVTELPFRETGEGLNAQSDYVFRHSCRTQRVPASFVAHDYNYRVPQIGLSAEHTVDANGEGRVLEHGLHLKLPADAELCARTRAELLLARRVRHEGTSASPLLRAGGTFTLAPDPDGNTQRLLVRRVRHQLKGVYTSTFEAQPSDVVYRPELVTHQPRISGYLTGLVQGDDPNVPNIDADGRYQVFFDCDGKDPGETRAARPMRMLQVHAGANYGMHFPLKPGTEVAVGFMNGDPDRPFIAGCLPNPLTPSPVRGERANVRRNVIQSHNGVQIELDDGAG